MYIIIIYYYSFIVCQVITTCSLILFEEKLHSSRFILLQGKILYNIIIFIITTFMRGFVEITFSSKVEKSYELFILSLFL